MRSNLKDKEVAILEATLELVNNRGFHASPMAKIAKMANVAPGTIYLYFENKDDLINKLYLYIKKEMTNYAFEKYNNNMSVEEGFNLIWNNIASYKTSHIKEAMFLSICDISPMIDNKSREIGLEYFKPFINLCIKGQKEGIIKDMPLHIIYAFSINHLSFLISSHQYNNQPLNKNTLNQTYKMVWDSIKK